MKFDQRFIEASDGAGNVRRFHYDSPRMASACAESSYRYKTREQAEAEANEYAQSQGGYGYVVRMGRNRLNDYVGPPIWSEPQVIEEL